MDEMPQVVASSISGAASGTSNSKSPGGNGSYVARNAYVLLSFC